MARFGPGVVRRVLVASLRASVPAPPAPCAADPRRVASSRDTAPRHARVSARLPRTGCPPPPCAQSSASPSDPDPTSGGVSLRSLCAFPPYGGTAWFACQPIVAVLALLRCVAYKGTGCELRAAEGGGWRTRGHIPRLKAVREADALAGVSGSSAASVVSLAETLSAEGSGLPRHIDLRAADATTPRRTARASSPPTDAAMPHGGFSLAAMRQSPLHTCFTGERQFSCLRKWGTSNRTRKLFAATFTAARNSGMGLSAGIRRASS